MNDYSEYDKLRSFQKEARSYEALDTEIADEMIAICRRHPGNTRLGATRRDGSILEIVIERGPRCELRSGCGCTYGQVLRLRSLPTDPPAPTEAHPDGERLLVLEKAAGELGIRRRDLSVRVLIWLRELGLGWGLTETTP